MNLVLNFKRVAFWKTKKIDHCFLFSFSMLVEIIGIGGSDGGGSGSDNMVVQEDTIFVSGMDPQTTEDDIAEHFGAIGIIKVS